MLPHITDPQDRQIFALLAGAKEHFGYYSYGYHYDQLPTQVHLSEPLPDMVLPMICQAGRCRLRLTPNAQEHNWLKMAWMRRALGFRLEVAPAPEGWELKGVLRRGETQMELKEPLLVHQTGFVFTRTHGARLE